jgi:hypothetical protein
MKMLGDISEVFNARRADAGLMGWKPDRTSSADLTKELRTSSRNPNSHACCARGLSLLLTLA